MVMSYTLSSVTICVNVYHGGQIGLMTRDNAPNHETMGALSAENAPARQPAH